MKKCRAVNDRCPSTEQQLYLPAGLSPRGLNQTSPLTQLSLLTTLYRDCPVRKDHSCGQHKGEEIEASKSLLPPFWEALPTCTLKRSA